MLVLLDPVYIKFECQGHRSKFTVTGWKMLLSGVGYGCALQRDVVFWCLSDYTRSALCCEYGATSSWGRLSDDRPRNVGMRRFVTVAYGRSL